MNEEYLQGAYNHYGGESVLGVPYEVWTSKIVGDEKYKRGMFEDLGGESGLESDYSTWNLSVFGVKKKEESESSAPDQKSEPSILEKGLFSFSDGKELSDEVLLDRISANLVMQDPLSPKPIDGSIESATRNLEQKMGVFKQGLKDFANSEALLRSKEAEVKSRIDSGERSEELDALIDSYNQTLTEYNDSKASFLDFKKKVMAQSKNIDSAVSEKISKEPSEGSKIGALYNSFLKGTGSVAAGLTEVVIDVSA